MSRLTMTPSPVRGQNNDPWSPVAWDHLTRTIRRNRWIPHEPTAKQAVFLALPVREALFGGSAGGGKTDALLMAALQYVDHPTYAALILRRTYADLALPGAVMDRAKSWLMGKPGVHWNDTEKTFTFPSGATLTFGYLQHSNDKYRYQGSELSFCGFDELTQFNESDYRYLFSRLRRPADSPIPIRMRATSNPGGIGHQWVYERFFVTGAAAGREFVPARLADNPHLDRAEYEQSLAELDPITRQQLLDGLWVTDTRRRPYDAAWWRGRNRYTWQGDASERQCVARWVSWDTAVKDKEDNAYTAEVVLELLTDYRVRVRHVHRERLTFPLLVPEIRSSLRRWNYDGKLRGVIIEDQSSGSSAIQTLRATLPQHEADLVIGYLPKVDKAQRGAQAAVWGKLGCVLLPYPGDDVPWLYDFEAELFAFPDSEFRDQADTLAQGILFLEPLIAEGHRARGGSEVAA